MTKVYTFVMRPSRVYPKVTPGAIGLHGLLTEAVAFGFL